ncbi:MAG: error-prone DNA polymerase [Dehalococcoidia bacterium]|nr:error-prone DNA polymerase [Dehalococcoidia bacterium]
MYIELHCHSNFSFLDGASHPADLVSRAKELGMTALALTDHNGLYGMVKFRNAAKEQGIKPVIGAEMTLDNGCHLTLLAKNMAGYSNLCRLISHAQLSHGKGQASLDPATLENHSEGLFCLSGCRRGEIPQLVLDGRKEEAVGAARRYRSIFGRHFYIELQNNLRPEDRRLCRSLVELATDLSIGYVATNNVHYAWREGHRLQDVLVCIKNRSTLDTSHHLRRPNSECYLKSGEEMSWLFRECPEALANTLRIAESCDLDLDLSSHRFPDFPVPQGETADSYLEKLCWERVRQKYRPVTEEVEQRLKEELRLIHKLGLAGYFLTVWDIMEYARSNDIPAQGRGSAASSIVTYILGVTRVDPVEHRLFAGRFLNDEMSAIPDIDIDIASDREDQREKLIQYIYQKHGPSRAAMLCNVVTYKARNAVREVGKAMGLPPDLVDRAARSLDVYSAANVKESLSGLAEFQGAMGAQPWEQFLDICRQIADFPRHLGIHVGGMIISTTPLSDIVPLEKATMPGRVVTQWDKDDISDIGLIKIDLLGLRMLSLIQEAVNLIRESRSIDLNLDNISLNDPRVYDMLCRGDTLGVFQVESRAQQATLPRSRPQCFEDLVAEVAIIRPGPIQGNAVHPYLNRRQGKEKVSYLHPSLEPVLKETLGVIIYQEQVIQVAMAIAGFTPGQADALRRAMSRKRSREAMERLREDFLQGARRNGVDEEAASLAFQQIASFAEFGFCKAHAAALAETTYRSAWLKLYYPAEYYCALLNCQPMGFYSPEVIVNQARHQGIRVLPVDINRSRGRCAMEEGQIRLGFRYVNGIGEKSWHRIEEQRKGRGYTSLEDFYTRTRLDWEAVENLIMVGAFDFLGVPRRLLLWQLGILMKQPPDAIPLQLPVPSAELPRMTLKDRVAADYQIQGLSATHHPMEVFRSCISKDVLKSSDMAFIPSGTTVSVAGCVVCRQMPGTAKGHVFITLEDECGLINIILRPQVYDKYRQIARLEPVIVVDGTLQKHDGIVNVAARRLRPVRQPRQESEPPPTMPLTRVRNFA